MAALDQGHGRGETAPAPADDGHAPPTRHPSVAFIFGCRTPESAAAGGCAEFFHPEHSSTLCED
jgi:hypothetical protein